MVRIRLAQIHDSKDIASVHFESWNETYRGVMPDHFLDGFTLEKRESIWPRVLERNGRDSITVVATDSGRIVGFANGGKPYSAAHGSQSELSGIYILSSHHRLGIGRKLMNGVVEWLVGRNYNSMMLWVIEDNPACRFYESLGGRRARYPDDCTVDCGGEFIPKVHYHWDDLTVLLSRL